MPVISEDNSDDNSPDIPQKSSMRAAAMLKQPLPGYLPPPPYSFNTPSSRDTDVPPPKKDRRPGWFAKRGGWFRVALFGLLGVVAVAALVIGLVLGLRGKG
jgi:hypothetical protein